jgi:tetratricopeptide (TPR) repeat protein
MKQIRLRQQILKALCSCVAITICPALTAHAMAPGTYANACRQNGYDFAIINRVYTCVPRPSAVDVTALQARRDEQARQQRIALALEQNQQGIEDYNRGDWMASAATFRLALENDPTNSTIRKNLELAESKIEDEKNRQNTKLAANNSRNMVLTFTEKYHSQQGSSPLHFGNIVGPTLNFPAPEKQATPLSANLRIQTDSRAAVRVEIQGIQAALSRLQQAINLDASQRREWEKMSTSALHNAYELGADATLDILDDKLTTQLDAIDPELKHELDLLSGETDADRRSQLHTAFGALKNRKDELERAHNAVEHAHDAIDILGTTSEAAAGEQEGAEGLLESAWNACGKFKLLPGWAGQSKAIVDASYDITVQVFSMRQITQLNANSEQYLKAVRELKGKMEALTQLQKGQQTHN